MPSLVSVEEAAREIAAGLKSQTFEITFPKRFTTMLKLARLLPYSVYFTLVNRVTGWRERPPSAGRHPVTPHAAE